MREIEVIGSFRYGRWFAAVVAAIVAGALVALLRTARFGLGQVAEAFQLAADRRHAMKVQLDFRTG